MCAGRLALIAHAGLGCGGTTDLGPLPAGEGQFGDDGIAMAAAASCSGMTGTECAGGDCCESLIVTGGTFDQGEPDAFRSTVSSFRLDRFEVTVERFRRFVDGYDAWRGDNPAQGAGAHHAIGESGWDAAWNEALPESASALTSTLRLGCDATYSTWDAGMSATLPINCVSWYEAFAFCIWDGGRLPTEAEWEYAAVGGSADWLYPWGSSPAPDDLDVSRAAYHCHGDGKSEGCAIDDILPVGSKPAGRGRFGQLDLAGSMSEWVLDSYEIYPSAPVSDHAALDANSPRVLRGGSWASLPSDLASALRQYVTPMNRFDFGFRCARAG